VTLIKASDSFVGENSIPFQPKLMKQIVVFWRWFIPIAPILYSNQNVIKNTIPDGKIGIPTNYFYPIFDI
jgi:hypothetical protein